MPQEASKMPSNGSKMPQYTPRSISPPNMDPHELQKTIKIHWKNRSFELLHYFSIRSLMYSILMPTWLHFRMKFRPRCLQAALKTPLDAPAWRPRQPRSHPITAPRRPRRTTTPSGWSQLRPAAPKAAKKPSKPRFWTLWTSILDAPDLDFGPSIRRFSILQTLSCILSYIVHK